MQRVHTHTYTQNKASSLTNALHSSNRLQTHLPAIKTKAFCVSTLLKSLRESADI